MSRAHIKRAVQLWRNPLAQRSTRRHNARQWLRSLEMLGDRWILSPANAAQRSGQ